MNKEEGELYKKYNLNYIFYIKGVLLYIIYIRARAVQGRLTLLTKVTKTSS